MVNFCWQPNTTIKNVNFTKLLESFFRIPARHIDFPLLKNWGGGKSFAPMRNQQSRRCRLLDVVGEQFRFACTSVKKARWKRREILFSFPFWLALVAVRINSVYTLFSWGFFFVHLNIPANCKLKLKLSHQIVCSHKNEMKSQITLTFVTNSSKSFSHHFHFLIFHISPPLSTFWGVVK